MWIKDTSEFERVVRSNICGDGYDAEGRMRRIVEAHRKEAQASDETWEKLMNLVDDFGDAQYNMADWRTVQTQNEAGRTYDRLADFLKKLPHRTEE